MEKCRRLEEYAIFVATVRKYKKKDINLRKAITLSIDECIEKGILLDILTKQRNEVLKVVLSTFNQELYEKNLKQDAYEEGRKAGTEIGKGAALLHSVQNVMKNLNVSEEKACEIIGISLDEYEKAKNKYLNKLR